MTPIKAILSRLRRPRTSAPPSRQGGEPGSYAALTMLWNEPDVLRVWARWYGGQLGAESLYVIDQASVPFAEELLPPGASVIRIPRGTKDEIKRAHFVSDVAGALLRYHEAVIYSDVDEMIVPDPARHAGLRGFLDATRGDGAPIAPTGVEIVQAADEAPIDWSRPILSQRRFARFFSRMCKPLVLRRPAVWTAGFHGTGERARVAEDLFLFHLKAVDRDHSLRRLGMLRDWTRVDSNVVRNMSLHQRTPDQEHIEAYHDAPNRQLTAQGPAPWSFGAEIARLQQGIRRVEGSWLPKRFHGPVARIPERFDGLI